MTFVAPDTGAKTDSVAAAQPSARAGLLRFWVGSAACVWLLSLTFRPDSNVTAFLLHRQDRWLLLMAAGLIALCCIGLPNRARLPLASARTWLICALAMVIVTYAGHVLLLCSYDLSRDEQMASFDAAIFGHGHLVQPLPQLWRDHANALNTLFMFATKHRAGWVSDYLPVNAGLRALFALVGLPYLTGSLMTALGALALWGCVRRLWPGDREACLVALLLYAGSAQVLFAGMTSYAMPDHLALNLVWLWLFLRNTRAADLGALVVGLAANGLHQPLFHPLFVAPFIVLLLVQRRWDRAALYSLGYLAIVALWMLWPGLTWTLTQAGADVARPAGVDFATRLMKLLHDRDPMGLPNMVANGLRFIAWQHLLLVPLMVIGARTWRKDPMVAALAGGMVLTALTMAVLLPFQGHGFGYRYFHGLIGNAILLAVYGWNTLADERAQWRALLRRTSIVGLLVMLPVQALMAHQFYAPSAQVFAQIGKVDADYVVIARKDVPTSGDMVLNPPGLDRRPVRLLRDELDPATIAAICARHPTVALIGLGPLAPITDYYALGHAPVDALNAAMADRLTPAGCSVRILR